MDMLALGGCGARADGGGARREDRRSTPQILGETFYFLTVVVMWLIHAGFMMYEAGAARRKNIMSTAIKNILTIAVVTPTFYYFGWYIYGCFQHGGPAQGHAGPDPEFPGFCGATSPWADQLGPNLDDHISAVFFLAFLLFSWTTGSIMSGALIERIRLSAYLLLTVLLGSAVWIMDAAWGWSSGGWLVTKYGFHDSIASLVVHGVAGAFTLGVLLNLGPRIGKYDMQGQARAFRPHNTHMTLSGLMLIFTGFYGFYAACLVIQSTLFPGWLNIYLSPTTLGAIALVITIGFAGGFTGGWFASKGDPFWTLSGGLAGVITVSAGADIYHPSLAYILSFSGAIAGRLGRQVHREEAPGRRCGRSRRCPRRLRLLRRPARRHLRRRLPDRREQHRLVVRRPARRDARVLPARIPAGLHRELGAEEAQPAARPARGRARGSRHGGVPAGLLPGVRAAARDHRAPGWRGGRGGADPARRVSRTDRQTLRRSSRGLTGMREGEVTSMIDSFPYESWYNEDGSLNTEISTFWTFGPGADHDLTGTFVLTGLGMLLMVVSLIAWVVMEKRALDVAGRPAAGRRALGEEERMPREKQVEFPPEQSPVKWLTPVLLAASVVCIVAVVIIVLVHDAGPFIGPW